MSDEDDTEDMSYDEDDEDYKYEEAAEEEIFDGCDKTCEADDCDDDLHQVELGPRKLRKLERQVSYQVHPVHKILANQKRIINEMSEMLGIPNHDSALLLRNYKWDKETACNAWWSEQTDLRIKIGLPAIAVQNLSTVSRKDACILCHRVPGAATASAEDLKSGTPEKNTVGPKSPTAAAAASAASVLPSSSTTSSSMIMGSRAINRDLKALFKQNVFETELPDEDNIFVIDLIIKCGGNWEGMTHKFRTKIPSNYPFSYPTVTCLESEKTLHPNIQPSDGSVCLGILSSEQWKAMFSLTDVCAALSSMFLSPNWEHSLNQEAFQLFHDNKIEFDRRLKAIRDTPFAGEGVKTETEGANDVVSEGLTAETTEAKTESGDEDASCKVGNQAGSKKQLKDADTSNDISVNAKNGTAATLCASGVDRIDINDDITNSTSSSSSSHDQKVKSTLIVPAVTKMCGECSPTKRTSVSLVKNKEDNSEIKNDELCTISETVAMACGHHLCHSCWNFLIQDSVDSGPGCLRRLCPAVGCTLVIPEDFVEKYCPEKLLKYRDFQLESFVSHNKAANYCPAPGCNNIVEYQKRDKTRIITCDCGYKWCWGCQSEPHAPISCRLIGQWEADKERLMSRSMSDIWVAVNVKTCPSCSRRIWKDGGCMHVTCLPSEGGCGTEFCWLCLDKWSTHGDGNGGFYACNKYQKAALEGTLVGEAKEAYAAGVLATALKKDVDRYEWHFERHKFMEQSKRLALERGTQECTPQCNKNAKTDSSGSSSAIPSGAQSGQRSCQHGQLHRHQQAIERALRSTMSYTPSAHQAAAMVALLDANSAVVACRDVLKWIYVALYFFPEDGPLLIFQSNHVALESHTEKLNKMIEKDWSRIAESAIAGKYKTQPLKISSYVKPVAPLPSNGGLVDCGLKIDLSPLELYDQLRLLRDITNETLRFMAAVCQASEFEEHFGF